MIYTVDRIEGVFAVLVDSEGHSHGAPLASMPEVSEGDVVEKSGNSILLRNDLTIARRKKMAERTRKLFQ